MWGEKKISIVAVRPGRMRYLEISCRGSSPVPRQFLVNVQMALSRLRRSFRKMLRILYSKV